MKRIVLVLVAAAALLFGSGAAMAHGPYGRGGHCGPGWGYSGYRGFGYRAGPPVYVYGYPGYGYGYPGYGYPFGYGSGFSLWIGR
jgi:hypothetical protein